MQIKPQIFRLFVARTGPPSQVWSLVQGLTKLWVKLSWMLASPWAIWVSSTKQFQTVTARVCKIQLWNEMGCLCSPGVCCVVFPGWLSFTDCCCLNHWYWQVTGLLLIQTIKTRCYLPKLLGLDKLHSLMTWAGVGTRLECLPLKQL